MRAKRVALPVKDSIASIPGVGDLVLDGQIDPQFYAARSFDPSWSFYIGWVGVTTCLLSSICVYTLSRSVVLKLFCKITFLFVLKPQITKQNSLFDPKLPYD